MKVHYQTSDHGAGKFSVQVFDSADGRLLDDSAIVRDINGWRVAGQRCDRPQHRTVGDAARHHATLIRDDFASRP
jgi:hypothetical protein